MDFFVALALLASSNGISETQMYEKHAAYCENLYWHEDALIKMQEAHCDIEAVWIEISRVQSWKY